MVLARMNLVNSWVVNFYLPKLTKSSVVVNIMINKPKIFKVLILLMDGFQNLIKTQLHSQNIRSTIVFIHIYTQYQLDEDMK
jgi:hypothetical protein